MELQKLDNANPNQLIFFVKVGQKYYFDTYFYLLPLNS